MLKLMIIARNSLNSITALPQNKNEDNRKLYAKFENFCVSLLRKVEKRCYEALNEKSVIANKIFWKTVKCFLSDKIVGRNKVHLTESGEPMKWDLETAEILNDFFFQT